ncbi:MAG: hypothetical protein WCD20_03035 [Rhodomicrobium sp.]
MYAAINPLLSGFSGFKTYAAWPVTALRAYRLGPRFARASLRAAY